MKMNMAQKVLLIIGGAFAGIGAVLTMIFGSIGMVFRPMRAFLALPLFFLILGICFIAAVLFGQHKKSLIVKNGIRYAAKIYGYVENTAYMVNGRFPVNVIVHYFDKNQIEREAVIPTAFEKGASTYPIGMTMDIYEYQGKYGWDPDSVRDEILPGSFPANTAASSVTPRSWRSWRKPVPAYGDNWEIRVWRPHPVRKLLIPVPERW